MVFTSYPLFRRLRAQMGPIALALAVAALMSLAPTAFANEDARFRANFPKAEAGNAEAMFVVGKIYLEGTSSAGADAAKGMDYISKAAAASYKPAMRFIADRVESQALDMCLKLKKQGDAYCENKMPAIVKRSVSKEATASSCKRVDAIVESGLRADLLRHEIANCALNGFSGRMSQAEALTQLRADASTNQEAFLKVLEFTLKKGSPGWDPLWVEDNLTKAGLTYTDKAVVQSFARNEITFDGCRKTDRLRRETMKQRPAICRMAARSGDGDAALYVGEAYLTGRDYFEPDAALAAEFIQIAANSPDPAVASAAFPMLLDQLRMRARVFEHFALIQKEVKRKSPHAKLALARFDYEAEFLAKHHADMDLQDITLWTDFAESNEISPELKRRVALAIDAIVADRGRLIKQQEKDSLLFYRRKLAGEPVQ
ncbi:MAG: hypothetical protein EBQ76_07700 [Betaproteobacteria bacterium]|nr:hypothetical protein [Betaproteobacteria bacterium]NBY14599.1 hypothetical protein [Betaproteobacteria bacterium]NCA17276.1 hypothetical protein [Betaproteobacteria bacterium]